MSSVLTVTQLNSYLGFKIKSDLKLKGIAVKGEISNFKLNYKTGHLFFTIKDEESAINGVMFASAAARLKFGPEDGMTVLVIGNVNVYERSGVCQIIALEIEPIGGVGAVHRKTEIVMNKLREQGIFDASKKKKIPIMPRKIAVVTSRDAAALQDILNIIERRYPICTVEVYPALTQGIEAVSSICCELGRADKSGADTLILARGGGSAEDLAPFNDENTVMAVYNCVTPVISAVGHETDTTLCDYAADLRAPTPSAAAELAVPEKEDLEASLRSIKARLLDALRDKLTACAAAAAGLEVRLNAASPEKRLTVYEERLAGLCERLNRSAETMVKVRELELNGVYSRLEALSPFNVLDRGFSFVEKDGRAVTSVSGLAPGDKVRLVMSDGTAEAGIVSVDVPSVNDKGR